MGTIEAHSQTASQMDWVPRGLSPTHQAEIAIFSELQDADRLCSDHVGTDDQ
jgi:hypothetical protein